MSQSAAIDTSEIICPVCAGHNAADAVFCANPECRKALGEFDFADELVLAETSRLEKLAEAIATVAGRPHFVTAHVIWFTLWVIFNSGLIASVAVFDVYPYSLLGIILSIEATLITSFLLISNNRQSAYADKRAQMDYEVNVKTYRLISRLMDSIETLDNRLKNLEMRSPRE